MILPPTSQMAVSLDGGLTLVGGRRPRDGQSAVADVFVLCAIPALAAFAVRVTQQLLALQPISYALTEATDEGHCGLPTDKLIPLAEELLEAPKELILTAVELELSEGNVIADKVDETACTFLAGLYRAEQSIGDRLIRIVNGRLRSGR